MMKEIIYAQLGRKHLEAIFWKLKVCVILFISLIFINASRHKISVFCFILKISLYPQGILCVKKIPDFCIFNRSLFLKKSILTWTIIVLISWKKESASIPIDISNITRMEGETIRLWCNAIGYPEPTVTWYAYQQTGAGEKLESKPNI